jgi:serine/threonine-protein kinase
VEDSSFAEEPTLPGAEREIPSQPAISAPGGLRVGELVAGRYRLDERIGAGAMGVVWQAEDTRLGRTVAMKVLHPDAADADAASRMRHEAKLLAQIEHGNVVRVFDAGLTDLGRPFVVMECVRGDSIARQIASHGPFPWYRAVELALQIADGLACAHDLGIIHRDLKPANVLVVNDARGRQTAKIIDFGLAKGSKVSDRTRIPTRTGEVFGTPAYMSPEQVRGETVDLRTDIYAFGAMLFEMLTGRRMWQYASVVEVLYAQLHEAPPLVRAHVADVPPEIEAIVARCVCKHASGRFTDAHALRSALQGAGTRGGTVAPQVVPRSGVAIEAAPARGGVGWIIGGLAIAAVAGFGITWWSMRDGAAPAERDVPRDDATTPIDDAPAPGERTPAASDAPAPAVAAPPVDAPPVDAPPVDAPAGTPPAPRSGEPSPPEPSPPEPSEADAKVEPASSKPRGGKPKPPSGGSPPEPAAPAARPDPEPTPPTTEPTTKPPAKPKVGPSGTFEDPFR